MVWQLESPVLKYGKFPGVSAIVKCFHTGNRTKKMLFKHLLCQLILSYTIQCPCLGDT